MIHHKIKVKLIRGYVNLIAFGICFTLTACTVKNKPDNSVLNSEALSEDSSNESMLSISDIPKEEEEIKISDNTDLFGNTMKNIANWGYAAENNGWIYFAYSDGLYKMKEDGTDTFKLTDNLVDSINVWDGWVYYSNDYPGKGEIYRTSIDGTKTEKINNERSYSIIINNNWIYYTTVNYINREIEYKIKRISLDGSNEAILVSENGISEKAEPTRQLFLYDGWIYYINMADNNRIYRISVDGTQKTKVSEEVTSDTHAISSFIIIEDWIYYTQWDGIKNKLFRMKTDGSSKEIVIDCTIHDFNIADEYIYFTDSTEYKYNLYKVKINGTEKIKLSDIGLRNINVINDHLYCQDWEWDSIFYMLDMNGDEPIVEFQTGY